MLASQAAHDKLADMAALNGDMESPTRELSNVQQSRRPKTLRRIETAIRSFLTLKNLTAEQVDNFMRSYIIYDLDWKDEKMMTETLGPDYQKKVGECLRDYYSVLNHMCAIGELEKMYVPPIMDLSANIFANQILYEESIAEALQLPENAKVLDLGCGRGRVAAHMSMLTGAQVTGLNIDFDQLASAVQYNHEQGLSNTFVRQDMNDLPLPFPDQEFDGFYQIQAFSLCKDIPKLCSEIYRVLKPGAKLSLLDWVSLEAFNPEDAHHRDLMRKIKPLIGAVGTPTPESMAKDLESAGFTVTRHENPSIDGLQAPLLERAKQYFGTAKWALLSLVNWGILPVHFKTLFDRFTKDSDAFIEADRSRLITTCYGWIAEKPKDAPLLRKVATGEPEPNIAIVPQHTHDDASKEDSDTDANPSADSSASSERMTETSTPNSEPDVKSAWPANSDSTGITLPPAEPLKSELSSNATAPIEVRS